MSCLQGMAGLAGIIFGCRVCGAEGTRYREDSNDCDNSEMHGMYTEVQGSE